MSPDKQDKTYTQTIMELKIALDVLFRQLAKELYLPQIAGWLEKKLTRKQNRP